MEKTNRRIDLYSLILGLFIAMIAQGIYDLLFFLNRGELSEVVIPLTLVLNFVGITLMLAIAWWIFREIKKIRKT